MDVSVLGVLLCVSMLDMVSGTCPVGTYGYDCSYKCHCPLGKCNATSGCSAEELDTGCSGPTCQKGNIALNKTTTASSVYEYGAPGHAVDGNNSADNHYECFQSDWRKESIKDAWWRVDLGDRVRIRDITIYFKTTYKVRRNGVQIFIADTAATPTDGVNCYNVTGNRDGTDIPDVLNVPCSGEGRYLVLYTITVNSEPVYIHTPVLDFCEVAVWVCSNGTLGDNNCHCDGEECDYVSGICPSGVCRPGWTTAACDTECLHSYGDGCSNMCSDRKCAESSSDSCDHVTGICEDGCRRENGSMSPLVAGFLGTLTTMVVVAVVIGAVCLWRRTVQKGRSKTGHERLYTSQEPSTISLQSVQ